MVNSTAITVTDSATIKACRVFQSTAWACVGNGACFPYRPACALFALMKWQSPAGCCWVCWPWRLSQVKNILFMASMMFRSRWRQTLMTGSCRENTLHATSTPVMDDVTVVASFVQLLLFRISACFFIMPRPLSRGIKRWCCLTPVCLTSAQCWVRSS